MGTEIYKNKNRFSLFRCSLLILVKKFLDGHISCSLIGQKADVPVRLIHLGNNVYKASYTPLISGKYELQVRDYAF